MVAVHIRRSKHPFAFACIACCMNWRREQACIVTTEATDDIWCLFFPIKGSPVISSRSYTTLKEVPTNRVVMKRNGQLIGPITCIFILEWTTSLDSSSGTLICPSLCPRHVTLSTSLSLVDIHVYLIYNVFYTVTGS